MRALVMRAFGRGADLIREHIDHLSSQDVGVRKKAVEALERFVCDQPENQLLLVRDGGIPPLVALLHDSDTKVRKKSVGVLRILAHHVEHQLLLIQSGAIAPLVALLSDADAEVRQHAVGALWHLPYGAESEGLIAGGIAPLVALLRDEDTMVRRSATGIVRNVAVHAKNNKHMVIAKAGGIAPLVALLPDEDVVVRQNAVEVLEKLSRRDSCRMTESVIEIARVGGIALLVGLLADADAEVRQSATGVLGNLALNAEYQVLIVRAGAIAPLVGLLRDAHGGVCKRSVFVLRQLADGNPENGVLIANSGGTLMLLDLLTHQDEVLAKNASVILSSVVANDKNKSWIAQAVESLVGQLRHEDAGVRQKTAEALGWLVRRVQNEVLVARAAASFVALCRDVDSRVRQKAVELLRDSEIRFGVKGERIAALVALLIDADTKVRRQASDALIGCSDFGAIQAVPPLLACLNDADAEVRGNAVAALLRFCFNVEHRLLLAQAGAIQPLIHVCFHDRRLGARQNAAWALALLALNDENQVLIARVGGIAPLVKLLGDVDSEVRKNVAWALGHLALNAENQALIRREGGMAPLVALLSDAATKVRKKALGALLNLALNLENKVLIAQAGGAFLVALLGEKDVDIRGGAVKVLRELVGVFFGSEQAIAVVLETQKQKEANAEMKEDLQYILSHWHKKPEWVPSNERAFNQESFKRDVTSVGQTLPASSSKLSAPNESSSQSLALPATEAYTIQASEVELGRSLGRGAFGEVYEAIYHVQKVAVKKYFGAQLRPTDRAKITAEIALMASLKHQCLVGFLGVIEESSGVPSLVMECAERGSLYDYLGAHRDIPWGWRLRVAEELARGLAYLHEKNVVHRDIKSLNVVLDEDLHAKWCDFGLAVLKQHATATHSHREQAAGSARWMAPELFEDEPVVSRKADIWSYGMVLFELAAQTIPYSSLNEKQVLVRLMKHKAEEVPEECKARVPKFAALMEVCWKVQAERPEASRLVEVLAEEREAYSGETQSLAATPETLASGFIGLSMNI